ncbi:hypothetical protein BGX38DRAFT_1269204 [Terfezia claveryi]|nr:hypothetical protein BGX38DRAFT_1269204 [Terfezia claveryi]
MEIERKETRGRPPKPPAPLLHWRTECAREDAAPKLREISDLIKKHFGGMRAFLSQWSLNDEVKQERWVFLKGPGCREAIEVWLPMYEQVPKDLLCDMVVGYVEGEAKELFRDTSSVLRYAKNKDNTKLTESISSGFEDMQTYVEQKAPLIWRLCQSICSGRTPRENTSKVITAGVLSMLNCRNQLMNGFQTIMGIFFYADNMSKAIVEVCHKLGWCLSFSHVNSVLCKLSEALKDQAAKDAAKQAMLISLDNVNKMVGVRDAISTRSGLMVNSTGGYCTSVFGMPANHQFIPREWANPGARVNMSPCALDPSQQAFEVMKQHNEWYMVELLKKYVGRGELAIGENEFKKP